MAVLSLSLWAQAPTPAAAPQADPAAAGGRAGTPGQGGRGTVPAPAGRGGASQGGPGRDDPANAGVDYSPRPPVLLWLTLLAAGAGSAVSAQTPIDRPRVTFATRDDATRAGCRPASVKGPGTDTCVTHSFHDNQLDLVVYEKPTGGAYAASDVMAITSWYWGAKLSLVDALGAGTQWMAVDTEGMRGTGISQRVLVVIAWDGARFRTVATETLGYRCSRPTSAADYRLDVRQTFESSEGTPRIRLDFELSRDEQRVGAWTGGLRWNAGAFAFEAGPDAVTAASPTVDAIRTRIAGVRDYALKRPLDPRGNSQAWIGESGLTNVLDPACVP
jgi:hypothetical protein